MINRFLQLLANATAAIPDHCFQLPVAERDDPIYRERVYCYELYHQLRVLLDENEELAPYVLSGEIDKNGHPIIRRCIPDLVFHIPREMGHNVVVVEVKPINGGDEGIGKDIRTLEHFVSDEVGYQVGVELVYGGEERDLSRFKQRIQATRNNKLTLFWHPSPGERAQRVL